MPSFDGKSLEEFYKTDYDYLEGKSSRYDRPPSGAEVAIDIATGGGPRSEFFRPLREAGIPRDEYVKYAELAEIKNVNSKSDFDQIIEAYKKDQMKNDSSASMKEMERQEEPIVFAKSEQDKRVDANRPYLDRLAENSRRGISNYVFGSKNPRQNVFNDDGSVKSDDDDMRDERKDMKAMDFANKFKMKMLDKMNRFDRAMR